MEVKLFELRDIGTHIPLIAIKIEAGFALPERANLILRRAGYSDETIQGLDGHRLILVGKADGGRFYYDPYDWCDRTFKTAHLELQENWDSYQNGDLIDVRYLLGESEEPCESELRLLY